MATRGDMFLRDKRNPSERPFGQHFTIQHDAYLSFFVKTFKEAYKLHKEHGYPLENCISTLHPGMLEANSDKDGGFYANVDLVDDR